MRGKLKKAGAPVAACCVLAGLLVDKMLFHTAPVDAAPYHLRVRTVAETVPTRIGSWVGIDVPVPPAAVALLHPNVILSRQYRDTQTGRQVSFLLVQCSDARDILGHYPPICYVGSGWTQLAADPKEWDVDGLRVRGTQYEFELTRLDRISRIAVDNFMLLPDGTTCPDMDGVTRTAQDTRKKFFGAAQIQIVSDGSLPPADRDALVTLFVRANQPVITEILSGVAQ